jgi:hypothetical protein
LQFAIPYSAGLQRAYETKLDALRAAAPLLRAITRREVLTFRLAHTKRALTAVS